MVGDTSGQKIKDLYPGNGTGCWKPITFKVIYKFPTFEKKNLQGDGKAKSIISKCLVADETGVVTLLHRISNAANSDKLQVGSCWTIRAGGWNAFPLNKGYPTLCRHPNGVELWIRDVDKFLVPDMTTVDPLLTPLNFQCMELSKLAKGVNSDIIAVVDEVQPVRQDAMSSTKTVYLSDASMGTGRIKCCLIQGHHTINIEAGQIVVLFNASVSNDGQDLVVFANARSAVFNVSSPGHDWMLNDVLRMKTESLSLLYDSRKATTVEEQEKQGLHQQSTNTVDASVEDDGSSPPKRKRFNSEVDCTFDSIDNFMSHLQDCNESDVKATIKKVTAFPGTLKRYLGCAFCSKSLRINEGGNYWCPGIRCQNRPKERNKIEERKSYYLLKSFRIEDRYGVKLGQDLVGYNDVIQQLLGKSADEFEVDTDVQKAYEGLVSNLGFCVTIHVSKKTQQMTVTKISLKNSQEPLSSSQVPDDEPVNEEAAFISALLAKREPLDIQVRRCRVQQSANKMEEEYKMQSTPRGIALHLTISKDREGSKVDETTFEILFKQLNFEVITKVDVSSKELNEVIDDCRKRIQEREKEYDALIMCISSHGMTNTIQLSDATLINVWTDIIYKFDDSNLPEFRGRPKIVFINACQSFPSQRLVIPPPNLQSAPPNHPDMLVFLATSPGYEAFRSLRIGTHFMRTLASVLMRCAHKSEIRKMFHMITKIMLTPENAKVCNPQLPEIRDFLFHKDFFFYP